MLDLGANTCNIAQVLTRPNPEAPELAVASTASDPATSPPLASKIGELIAADTSSSNLFRDADLPFNSQINIRRDVLPHEAPESQLLAAYPDASFDAVLSSLSLHWINDLPGILTQINRVLKPDSPFLGVMLGGDTVFELRTSLQLASLDRLGGVGLHTSPLADVRDVGGLLQRAGFRLLTVDVDDLVVDYPDVFALMQDLQAMGEQNCVAARAPGPINRDVLAASDSIYRALHGNEDGSLPATFRLIYMIGWKEGPDQPKPLRRGTGMVSIKDVLEGRAPAGDGDGSGPKSE